MRQCFSFAWKASRSSVALAFLVACANNRLTEEQRLDPDACADCHPLHHAQWAGSMHAYAAEDPVFLALNALGQHQTEGALGDFCVSCHAPVAVELGLTTDGLNLSELPAWSKGVTCAFCHSVEDVEGDHNNPLVLDLEGPLRGGLDDPERTGAHASTYSPFHDRRRTESSALCGSCHDIVTPLGARIERTFDEWKQSLFADPSLGLNCGGCHMQGTDGPAAQQDGRTFPVRRIHDHSMVGVDVAVTPFPMRDEQAQSVQRELDQTLLAFLCVDTQSSEVTTVSVTLENVAAGHSFPSGATADRRVWVDVSAWRGDEQVLGSGQVADDRPLSDVSEVEDPDLWRIHSTLFDAAGDPTHFFWDAASIDGQLLAAQGSLDPADPNFIRTHESRQYSVPTTGVDRVSMAVRMRPLPLDLLDELAADGWLHPDLRDAFPTWTLGSTVLTWTPDAPEVAPGISCVPDDPAQSGITL